jgi:hypothetical protein
VENNTKVTQHKEVAQHKGVTQHNSVLTLAQEAILWPGLLVIVHPCRQIGVRIRINIPFVPKNKPVDLATDKKRYPLIDICGSWEVWRITTNVFGVWWLIYTYPIDFHRCREKELREVDISEAWRHS